MTAPAKRAAIVIAIVLAFAIYSLMSNVAVTGSGGLGAVSAAFTELTIEFLLLFLPFVSVFLYCRHRRQVKRQPAPRP